MCCLQVLAPKPLSCRCQQKNEADPESHYRLAAGCSSACTAAAPAGGGNICAWQPCAGGSTACLPPRQPSISASPSAAGGFRLQRRGGAELLLERGVLQMPAVAAASASSVGRPASAVSPTVVSLAEPQLCAACRRCRTSPAASPTASQGQCPSADPSGKC